MKKIIIFLFFLIPIFCYGYVAPQLRSCIYIDGEWTNWTRQEHFITGRPLYPFYLLYNRFEDNFEGFRFKPDKGPLNSFCFKFEIDNYIKPNKREIKQHLKNEQWYEYTGWVEYFVCERLPTIYDVLIDVTKNASWINFPNIPSDGYPARVVKRRARAIIKIAPYKKIPKVFNIYFDGVGVGLWFDRDFPKEWKKYFVK